jgi:hypothetical protein
MNLNLFSLLAQIAKLGAAVQAAKPWLEALDRNDYEAAASIAESHADIQKAMADALVGLPDDLRPLAEAHKHEMLVWAMYVVDRIVPETEILKVM